MTPPIGNRLTLRELPFHLDLLDSDLDDKYPGLPTPIHWGMLVGVVDKAWSESVQVPGFDWELRLCVPGDVKLPTNDTPTGRLSWRGVARYCAFAVVLVKEQTPNRARDTGRPAVRALLAMLRHHYPPIMLSDTIWEGVVTLQKGKTGLGAVGLHIEAREPKQASQLSEIGLDLTAMKILAVPHHVTRALEWMQLARASPVRVDAFAHLWFALIALVRFGQPESAQDLTRILAYLAHLRSGTGGHPVLSRARVDSLETLFKRANRARHRLFHRDDDSLITDKLIEQLEDGLFQLIEPEVARVRAS